MTTHKRKKIRTLRGTRSCSRGHKRRAKGGGNRGGRGLAGTGKRAQANKPSVWKIKYMGRSAVGFSSKNHIAERGINIGDLGSLITKFNNGFFKDEISFSNGIYTIDLTKLGYDKLLSKGNCHDKVKVIVEKMTDSAKEKLGNGSSSEE